MAEPVLITGARSAVAVDLARDFHRAGYDVHLVDSVPAMIARFSCAPIAVHRVGSPRQHPAQFARDIQALVAKIDPVRLIPTCEEVFHLSRPSIAEGSGKKLFAPSRDILRLFHGKHSFAEFCEGQGLSVPETRLLTNSASLQEFAAEPQRWVFKPCFSRFGTHAWVGPERVPAISPSPDTPWVAQRRIKGTEYSFYAVAQAGLVVALAAYGSSWRLKGGASFAFNPAPQKISQAVGEIAASMARATGFTGQFSCDFIVDTNGKIWVIECNPRATSGLHLLTDSGALARAIMSEDAVFAHPRETPQHMLAAMCSYGLAQAARQKRWRDWSAALRLGEDVIGRPGDRRPVLGALADVVYFKAKGQIAGISISEALTADMEWNGEVLP